MGVTNRFIIRFTCLFIVASMLVGSSLTAQILTKKQQDSAFLLHPGQERLRKIQKSFAKTFVNYTDINLSLYGALNFSNQNINDKAITAPLNYLYNNVNSNSYETGYSGGFRIDYSYKEKKFYSLSLGVNRIVTGNHYENKYSLSPFIEDFTHFKADNTFTTLNLAFHAKILLPVNAMNKYKFYAVIGPSIDYVISDISNENLINKAGRRAIYNGDIGAEFDNKGFYVLFAHYKIGQNSTTTIVPMQLQQFQIGMSIKAKDLF